MRNKRQFSAWSITMHVCRQQDVTLSWYRFQPRVKCMICNCMFIYWMVIVLTPASTWLHNTVKVSQTCVFQFMDCSPNLSLPYVLFSHWRVLWTRSRRICSDALLNDRCRMLKRRPVVLVPDTAAERKHECAWASCLHQIKQDLRELHVSVIKNPHGELV